MSASVLILDMVDLIYGPTNISDTLMDITSFKESICMLRRARLPTNYSSNLEHRTLSHKSRLSL